MGTMEPGTSTTEPNSNQNQPKPEASEPPAWFAAYTATADKRFEGLANKLAEVSKAPAKEPAAPVPVTASNLTDALVLGRLTASLDKEAQAEIESLISGGQFGEARRFAEFASKVKPASTAGDSASTAPTGAAPAAAHSTASATHPRTYAEWVAIEKRGSARDASDADVRRRNDLRNDRSFDPFKLR